MPQHSKTFHIQWWPRLGSAAAMPMLTTTGMSEEADGERLRRREAASTTTLFINWRPLTKPCCSGG
eukprot:5215370-Pyramimonas_sp.AAC.1